MKKIIIFFCIAISVYAIYKIYTIYRLSNEKDFFVKTTGISNFDIISTVNEDEYFYITAKIAEKDKQIIMGKHYYVQLPVGTKGIQRCYFNPKNENNYLYYLDDSGYGYQGYVVYFISKVDNTITFYYSYPD